MRTALAVVAGALLASLLALAFGWGLLEPAERSPATHLATAMQPEGSPDVAELAVALAEERAAREALAEEVAWLSAELAVLRGAGASGVDLPAEREEEAGDERARAQAAASAAGEVWFDEERLLAGGLRPNDAEALRELYEEIQLERLYARDAAAREGWTGPRLRQEFRALDERIAGVREEWGEDVYDWFLYAADRTNRVEIEGVLGGSPASEAGVRPGDVVISYAGRRIYTPAELRRATAQGRLGDVVTLEVVSGGRTRRLDVPRGPLGVRLDARSVPPS